MRGGEKSGIHLAEVSVFARMTGKNRHFRDLSQQVLSGVVVYGIKKKQFISDILAVINCRS